MTESTKNPLYTEQVFLLFHLEGAQGYRNKMCINSEHRWDEGRMETNAAGGLNRTGYGSV